MGPVDAVLARRFEYEDGEAVLYCYELQVARAAQQRGLGRAMMDLLEQIVSGRGCVVFAG